VQRIECLLQVRKDLTSIPSRGIYWETHRGQTVSIEQIRLERKKCECGYLRTAFSAITPLGGAFVAGGFADNFIIFRKLGG
jgi:hypothetical protein